MAASENNRTKEELSRAILDTARQLFEEQGIETVSMHQIAKSAGIGQGTLYRRYANKAELCMEIMRDQFDLFREQIERYLTETAHESVESRLKGIVSRTVDLLDLRSQWLSVLHAQHGSEMNKFDFYQSPPYQFLHGTLSRLLQEGATTDKLAAPIDSDYVADAYIAIMSPHMHRQLVHVKGYGIQELKEKFCVSFIDPLFAK